jgi:uncharacterized cupredoxin-like copper-binding protein
MTGTRIGARPRVRTAAQGPGPAAGTGPRPRWPRPRRSRTSLAALAVPTLLLVAAGLLLTAGALLLQPGRAPAATQRTVVLTMYHSHFQPALVRVEPGTTVRFVLRNTDPIDHEFIVGDEAVHQRHRVGRDRHHHGEVPGEISVPSGTEASTTFRFDQPGRLTYACHLPGHEAYGMVGTVEVG